MAKPVALVVDDSLDTIHMLHQVLESAQFTVLIALEGAQALTITQNIRPDIILLDALMPHMDGFETCIRLKKNPSLAEVPIIFMTGLSDSDHIVQGLEAGGVDYIAKPLKQEELLARMRVHISNAQKTRNAQTALDSAGHHLITVDQTGKLLWATPQAFELLSQNHAIEAGNVLTPAAEKQLKDWFFHMPEVGRTLVVGGLMQPLSVEILRVMEGAHYSLRLTLLQPKNEESRLLQQQFSVTTREADVLLWIAKGKTNREIAQILNMSPRTVNKHLEQIFRKLGVENRTAAAAIVINSTLMK